jgi:hypothetical protein
MLEIRTGGEKALLLFDDELGAMINLIDEGQEVASDPTTVNRSTAEQATGAVFNRFYVLASQGELPPEEDVIPTLLYTTFLPYLGEEAAREQMERPAPPYPDV